MTEPLAVFPIWVIIIDYLLGVIMWTLVGRVAMGLFLKPDSDFFFMKVFVKGTDPIIRVVPMADHAGLPDPAPGTALRSPGSFFMIRFYLMPWLLGYSVHGHAVLPAGGRDRPRDLQRLQLRIIMGDPGRVI